MVRSRKAGGKTPRADGQGPAGGHTTPRPAATEAQQTGDSDKATHMGNTNRIGVGTATVFVIANMIGTGVFTSLGFQLLTTTHPLAIALLWLVGGVVALCGAVAYSELGAAMPRSGGEYHYLSVVYHPAVGFLSGWTSLIVGFAAPVALSAMAMSSYVSGIWPAVPAQAFALAVVTAVTLCHAFDAHLGTRMQNVLTVAKVLIIVAFIAAGLRAPADGAAGLAGWDALSASDVLSPGFAVSLIWVYYAYSGWNAAAYIAGDMERPRRNVPLALLCGTLVVLVLYLGLNMTFLRTTPVGEMTGQIEIGLISARHIFGPRGGEAMGLLIALMLASSVSSMVYVGPRVSATMGEDHALLRRLAHRNRRGVPTVAIWVQWALSVVMILTGAFRQITQYTGVVLSLCALLTVAGVAVHRWRYPGAERPYRVLAYPWPVVIFCVVMLWSVVYMLYSDFRQTWVTHEQAAPWTALATLLTVVTGLGAYGLTRLRRG